MLSKSVDDLHRAFRNWTDRVNNYAVADVEGNFGYLHEGKIPIRGEENGWRAVPGWTGSYEWAGYIPQNELPRAINPESGYVVSCNQRVAESDYPYYVGLEFAPEHRARCIQERILQLGKGTATAEEMGDIHAERKTRPGRVLVDRILKIEPASDSMRKALSYLREWDCRMDREMVAPTIYAEIRTQLIERVARTMFGSQADRVLSGTVAAERHVRLMALEVTLGLEKDDPSLLSDGSTWEDALSEAVESAMQSLRTSLGDDMTQWKWGRVHRTHPRHPLSDVYPDAGSLLDPPSLAVHGDGDTPLAGSYPIDARFDVNSLSVNRYIHDVSDWRNSRWIVPLGASGHPGSPHYADQAKYWADVKFIPQLWDWGEIEEKAETYQRLESR
jgi:penicillin amidase